MARKKRESSSESLLREARESFADMDSAEARLRELWREDLRFRALEQWPEALKRQRQNTSGEPVRPCLVIDQVDQYVRQVLNDARQNKPAMKARPVDDKGDKQVAEALQGLFRHIEDISRAPQAYLTALDFAVTCGRGFFEVVPEYTEYAKGLQEPRIKRIPNALHVWFDPYCVEMDGCDAMEAFLCAHLSPAAFKRNYPGAEATSFIDRTHGYGDWIGKESIRVARWYKVSIGKEPRIVLPDGRRLTEQEAIEVKPDDFREEMIEKRTVKLRTISATDVLDETDYPSEYIGIIPVYGNDRWLSESDRDIYGMVRPAMDPQRLVNYSTSAMVERIALDPKAPWVTPHAAVTGHETIWKYANTSNRAYLPYNHIDGRGEAIPAPSRQPMDTNFSGWVQLMGMAQSGVQASLGMYSASVGAPGNEKSGRAIMARQREGDVSTFHYVDNLGISIQHAGRIIMQMLPKLYDVARVARILGDDGEASSMLIDPQSPEAYRKVQGQRYQAVLNPTIGAYDVTVSVGPSYSTKRQEGAAAMGEALGAQPQLMPLIGDLYFRSLDVPYSDEIADRLKSQLPPNVLATEEAGDVPAEVVQVVQQITQVAQQREQMMQQAMTALQQQAEQMKQAQARAEKSIADMKIEQAQLDAARTELRAQQMVTKAAAAPIDAAAAVEQIMLPVQQMLQQMQVIQADMAQNTSAILAATAANGVNHG